MSNARHHTTRLQLAAAYDVSLHTLRRWLQEAGVPHSYRLSPAELERLYFLKGKPPGKT